MPNSHLKPIALLVEDDASFSTQIREILEENVPEFEYQVAPSIEEAEKLLQNKRSQGRFRILLLDIMLPPDAKVGKRVDELGQQREEVARGKRPDEGGPVETKDELVAMREERVEIDRQLMTDVNLDGGITLLKKIHDSSAWASDGGTVIIISGRDLSSPELQKQLQDAVGKLTLRQLQKPPNPDKIIRFVRECLPRNDD